MKKKHLTLLFVAGGLATLLVIANFLLSPKTSADKDAMSAAERLYQAGNYYEAGRIYEQLINQGVQDSAVFYNLGNSYYRQADLGKAIVNYQRAALLNPRDTNIRANLELAREQAGIVTGMDNGLTVDSGPIQMLEDLTGKWLTLNEAAILTLTVWFLAGLLVLAWRMTDPGPGRSAFKIGALVMLFLLLLSGLSLASRLLEGQRAPGGVVIVPSVAVSTEPGVQFQSNFNLQGGTEISVVETAGQWARLETPGLNNESWIPLDAVEFLASGQEYQGISL